jgi:hypothetical protein
MQCLRKLYYTEVTEFSWKIEGVSQSCRIASSKTREQRPFNYATWAPRPFTVNSNLYGKTYTVPDPCMPRHWTTHVQHCMKKIKKKRKK